MKSGRISSNLKTLLNPIKEVKEDKKEDKKVDKKEDKKDEKPKLEQGNKFGAVLKKPDPVKEVKKDEEKKVEKIDSK